MMHPAIRRQEPHAPFRGLELSGRACAAIGLKPRAIGHGRGDFLGDSRHPLAPDADLFTAPGIHRAGAERELRVERQAEIAELNGEFAHGRHIGFAKKVGIARQRGEAIEQRRQIVFAGLLRKEFQHLHVRRDRSDGRERLRGGGQSGASGLDAIIDRLDME